MEKKEVKELRVLQEMIILSADRLDGLRTQCTISAEITQHEIRSLEGKLVKLFSQQLIRKKKIPKENLISDLEGIPSIRLWLQVVGLSTSFINDICKRVNTLENLKEKTEGEISNLMEEYGANEEEKRRLTKSLSNLKRYCQLVRDEETALASIPASNHRNDLTSSSSAVDSREAQQQRVNELLHSDFYWDSWDSKVTANTVANCTFNSSTHHLNGPSSGRMTRDRGVSISSVPAEIAGGSSHHHYKYNDGLANTTPCTPVTSAAPVSLASPSKSFSSAGSTFSPSSSSSPNYDPNFTPPPISPTNKERGRDNKESYYYSSGNKEKDRGAKFPTTPPAARKKTGQNKGGQLGNQLENFPLTKSKSHESQLADTNGSNSSNATSSTGGKERRQRLPTESEVASTWDPNTSSPIVSPIKSPPATHYQTGQVSGNNENDLDYTLSSTSNSKSGLQVPKSPRTPTLTRSMGHVIAHRFTKMFKVSTCDYCFKQVIIGLKCKECKFKCHRDCEPKVPPSCGLPPGFINVFAQCYERESLSRDLASPIIGRLNNHAAPSSSTSSPSAYMIGRRDRKVARGPHVPPFSGPDSSSNTSSCNSSTPSSPAFFAPSTTTYQNHLFHFPDCCNSETEKEVSLERPICVGSQTDMSCTEKSNDSDRTVSQTSGSGSTDSEKTLAIRVDSQDSQISDGEQDRNWPRQNSLSNREWDIPFDELKIGEKIGIGHFGTVYRGNWHGDVAIKLLDLALDNEKTLEQFKQEVAIFRKTRHENLVLFMGACMKPPRLAIVTALCKGMSLYTHIHLRKDKFNMNKTVLIAQQIAQGMGYLHARGIVHKDLKSKNAFLESGKVVITDFGLFSVTKLLNGNHRGDQVLKNNLGDCLSIPPGWLCYLAPEVMKCLRPSDKIETDLNLPFSKASDVYAFGTVWYELLCSEWPYKGLPPEAIIWQVGSGVRQPLPAVYARDVKISDILMSCWSADPDERTDFTKILKTLEKLPKKRLARSPSHPIHLSRSAESVF